MKIIGISAYYHDSAVALISDGEILYASQEERFTRLKGDASFPINALSNLFHFLRLNPGEIDAFVFYDKPFLKFERLLETYVDNAPRGYRSFRKAIPIWLKEKFYYSYVAILVLKLKADSFFQNITCLMLPLHFIHHLTQKLLY